jgi:hypothetical protein
MYMYVSSLRFLSNIGMYHCIIYKISTTSCHWNCLHFRSFSHFVFFWGPQNISDQQVLGFGSGESQWYFDMYWLRCDRFDSKLSRYCTGSTNVQLFLYATGYQRLDRLELLRGLTAGFTCGFSWFQRIQGKFRCKSRAHDFKASRCKFVRTSKKGVRPFETSFASSFVLKAWFLDSSAMKIDCIHIEISLELLFYASVSSFVLRCCCWSYFILFPRAPAKGSS